MTTSTVHLELVERTAVVTLDAPPLNIFDLEMRDGLIEALTAVRDIDTTDTIDTMVLTSAGKHFSAGADLSEFGSAESIHEARRIRWDRDPWGTLWDLPMPTIAAISGVAVGSGMEMAMLCDLRIGAPTTNLGLPETKLGMLPAAGGTQSLTKTIGPHAAVPLVALADTMTADEAFRRRVLTMVADDPQAQALDLAARFGAMDREAVRATKQALRAAVDQPLIEGLATERRLAERMAAIRRRAPR